MYYISDEFRSLMIAGIGITQYFYFLGGIHKVSIIRGDFHSAHEQRQWGRCKINEGRKFISVYMYGGSFILPRGLRI